MKKVRITLRGGGALEWTPKNKTRNVIGLWNWMNRTQNSSAILNFEEGGVRISEIAAMEYIEEPEQAEPHGTDEQYQVIKGIVYATGEESIKEINSFERIDVYPNLSSLVKELKILSAKDLTGNKYVFAEITCRVPLDEFERFEEGKRVFANRRDIVSAPVKFELSYKLLERYVDRYEYAIKENTDSYITVNSGLLASGDSRLVYALVPVVLPLMAENGSVMVPCYHVTPTESEDS